MDVFNLTVKQISKKIKDAQLTSVDLCKTYIERIKKFEKDKSIKKILVTSSTISSASIIKKIKLNQQKSS